MYLPRTSLNIPNKSLEYLCSCELSFLELLLIYGEFFEAYT